MTSLLAGLVQIVLYLLEKFYGTEKTKERRIARDLKTRNKEKKALAEGDAKTVTRVYSKRLARLRRRNARDKWKRRSDSPGTG